MAVRRTIDFLPDIFKTQTNKKFLNATVDQLIQEPKMTRMSSFIGRAEGSSVYKKGDAYIQEGDPLAQYYQLEPATVVRQRIYGVDKEYKVDNVYNYLDMLNRVSSQGGIVNNHDRLFNSEYYNYTGFVELDKLINYTQYYWVPSGPDSVDVYAGELEVRETFTITRPMPDQINGTSYNNIISGDPGYTVSGFTGAINPTITLVRGGYYTFDLYQDGYPFFIQSEPGVRGSTSFQNNLSIRDVKGVKNNGASTGEINFAVPKKTDQDDLINMEEDTPIDYVLDIPFNEIANCPVDQFYEKYSLDGVRRVELNKAIVFTNPYDDGWFYPGNFSKGDTEGYDTLKYDQGEAVPLELRSGVWFLSLDENNLLQLSYLKDFRVNTKLYVKEGNVYGNRYVYKDTTGTIRIMPNITAHLDTLYYQDARDANIYGIIRLVEQGPAATINIDDILGKKVYTSPNGIKFTNGLKVKFKNTVVPESYLDGEYVVEGVGTGITLTKWENLVTPESYTVNLGSGFDATGEEYDTTNYDNTLNAPNNKDYIVINRSSPDANPWSRVNRWFHKNVLEYSSNINTPGIAFNFIEENRAKRPIIEFVPNLLLFNSGWNFLTTASIIDVTEKDAFSNIEGTSEYYVDGVRLLNGVTIIFAADTDETVRNTVYTVEKIDIEGNGNLVNHLVPYKTANHGDTVVIISGLTKQGLWYYWDSNLKEWVMGQQKFSLNQTPYFDVADKVSGISFSDKSVYTSSNFEGSKLFSYKTGTGSYTDPELGISLTYKTIGNIGDIVFDNNFDTDTFIYSLNNKDVTVNVNRGNAIEVRNGQFVKKNPWTKIQDKTKQYIERTITANVNKRNEFDLNLIYVNSVTERNIFVYVNGIERNDYQLLGNEKTTLIAFPDDLNVDDRVLVRVYGLPNDLRPIYTVPKNLEKNSQNNTFETITLGQMRNHLFEISKNSLDFRGEPAGGNNLRDINYTTVGGNLLQHTGSFFVAQLLMNHPTLNIIEAINFNRREYNRFKDTFLDLLENREFKNINDTRAVLDQIMGEITSLADISKPFYYSDMLPYGNDFIKTSYEVFNPSDRTYNTVNLYDYEEETSFYQTILVYQNSKQLIKGRDYTLAGRVVTITDNVILGQDDILDLYEYKNTFGCMVPATPSKLGLFPAYIPVKYSDNTIIDEFVESKNVIQGHDGSIMLAFNDFRDDVILEFERRVYNTIKVYNDEESIVNYHNVQPGFFRETEYSFDEWTQLLSSTFLDWAGNNNIDIFTNNTVSNDLFSFNYSEAVDKLANELMPGYWRAIYKYFYDTDRPHTHPWEMLGYSNKPDWWENRYGTAPYTSGNLVLWEDLEKGLDFTDAVNPVLNERYVRPGLTNIIPVDEHGNLLPPQYAVVASYNTLKSDKNWRFGDQGPAESAWRRSSDYPFAVMIAYALAKPVEFCTYGYNTRDYQYDPLLEQIINRKNNNRKFATEYTTADEHIPGLNVYLRDNLLNIGIDLEKNLKYILDDSTVNLAYKMSGFTDKKYIKILAEQTSPGSKNTSILIPESDYDIVLTKSAPVFRTTYSGVIIEKSPTGYIISGFDNNRPYFKIIPSIVNNNNYTIKVGNNAVIAYKDGDKNVLVLPYGTELTSKQQVADFLICYGRYLENQGFKFNDYLVDKSSNKDWSLAVKEFLFWTQQAWDEKTILSVTPTGSTLKYDNGISVVDDINNSFNGTRLIDSFGKTLSNKDYRVYRSDTSFEILLKDTNAGIHLLDIEAVQYEHTLVFNNVTEFNDVIYEPNLGNRQLRLKIVGNKTADWNGSLTAPGFLINHRPVDQWTKNKDYYKGDLVRYKNKFYTASKFIPGANNFDQREWYEISNTILNQKLIPNAAFNAKQFENFYDIDNIDLNINADEQGRHVSGFQPRKYFTDIGVDIISQHKFYIGMIHEKGTAASIDKFLRAKLPYIDNDIEIDEEYAFRLGSYGDLNNRNILELPLNKVTLNNKIAIIELLEKNDSRPTQWNSFKTSDLSYVPNVYNKNVFEKTHENKIYFEDAGYAQLSEVSATVYDVNKISNISPLSNIMGEGSRVWVSTDIDNNWNMYRVSNDMGLRATFVQVSNKELTFTTSRAHGFSTRDKILIKNAVVSVSGTVTNRVNISGFYRVLAATEKTFTVETTVENINPGDVNIAIFKLKSIRYNSRVDFASDSPYRGWRENDIVYIDNVGNNWQVLKNNNPWNKYDLLTPVSVSPGDNFGKVSAFSYDEKYYLVTSEENIGKVYIYGKDEFNNWSLTESIVPKDSYGDQFGASVTLDENLTIAIGAPATDSNQGAVYVGKINQGVFEFTQVIYDQTLSANSGFGKKIVLSKDGKWLYIARVNDQQVDAYQLINTTTDTLSYAGNGSTDRFTLPSTVVNANLTADQIKVFVDDVCLVPFVDYIMVNSNQKVELTVVPANGTKVRVEYSNYYQYVDTITNPSLLINNFGYDLSTSTDGRYLIISANTEDVTNSETTYSNAGAIYAVERSTENFIADGISNSVTTYYTPNYETVKIDGVLVKDIVITVDDVEVNLEYVIVGNTISFSYIDPTTLFSVAYVPKTSEIISVETNNFNIVQSIKPPVLQDNTEFGTSVKICPTNCSLYAGSPGYFTQAGDSGAVYRFVNISRLYGTKQGTKINPTVTLGNKIRINDYQVTFTGGDLATVIADINAAGIPGVAANKTDDEQIIITTDSQLTFNKLLIVNDLGTGVEDLGIEPYEYVQTIESPFSENLSRYGELITVNFSGNKIVVGTTRASARLDTVFDGKTTTFDRGITPFKEIIRRSGAAYLYEYQRSAAENYQDIGKFSYATKIITDNLKTNDGFASSINIGSNWLMVTAPNLTVNGSSRGAVIQYYNQNADDVWKVIRQQPAGIDSDKLTRAFIYNKESNKIVAELPVLDNRYGKLMPNVDEKISYTSNYDPAVYNIVPAGTGFSFDRKNAWGKDQIGKLWWDTNALKYLEWNQSDLYSRALNRDLLFPSSSVNVYQWIESLIPPAAYANGTIDSIYKPLYTVNNAFSQFEDVDDSGNSVVKYYFWVRLNVTDSQFNRNNNTIQYITSTLTNPRSIETPYISIIAPNAVALYNCQDIIGSDYVLKMEYNKNVLEKLPVHTEWSIFNDGTRLGFAEEIYNKLIDSLAAQDSNGRVVPDATLALSQKYGLDVRPRQTMFKDPIAARKLFYDFANDFFKKYPITLLRDITAFTVKDDFPSIIEYDETVNDDVELTYITNTNYIGKTVLVKKDSLTGGWTLRTLNQIRQGGQNVYNWNIDRAQKFDNTLYWDYADWYAYGFNAGTIPTYQTDFAYELNTLPLKSNDIVKIINSNSGGWQLVKITADTIELVGQQNATLKLRESIYNTKLAGFGIDDASFESQGYDRDNAIELRNLFDAFINTLIANAGVYVDEFRKVYKEFINQYINLLSTQFIETDWLFKTSFISIRQQVGNLDQIPVYSRTSEDIVQNYIQEVKPYHTKIRQYLNVYKGLDTAEFNATDFDLPPYYNISDARYRSPELDNSKDDEAFTQVPYTDWLNNYKYFVESIDIIKPGQGYTNDSVIIISGGGGFGAKARIKVRSNGAISNIIMINPGKDYLDTPDVKIEGPGKGAVLRARLGNKKVRTFKTTVKFDRYTYSNSIQDWEPNTEYQVGDLFVYNNVPYRVTAYMAPSSTIELTNATVFRVYNWEPNTRYRAGDILVKSWANNEYYEVVEDLTTINIFTTESLMVYTGPILDTAADRTWSYYTPAIGEPGRILSQLMTGLEYPGVQVKSQTFEQAPGFDVSRFDTTLYDDYEINEDGQIVLSQGTIDTIYNSSFTDSALGIRPEDIITDGAGFVDTYSSHAPEELVPGRIFDSLSVKVTTLPTSITTDVYAPDMSLIGHYLFGGITFEFRQNVIGTVEKLFVYSDQRGYFEPDVDYSIDWINSTITLTDPTGLLTNELLFILSIGSTGLGIIDDLEFIADGVTTTYEVANLKEGNVGQVYVKINGAETKDYELFFNPYGRAYVIFDTAPAEDSYIQIHAYTLDSTTQAYSAIKEVRYTVSGTGSAGDPVTYPDGYIYNLPQEMRYAEPFDSLISVKLNGEELAPANNSYYTADGSTIQYAIPSTSLSSDSLISNNDIVVVVDLIKQSEGIDYQLIRDGSSLPIVEFYNPPAAGLKIVISDSSIADYRVVDGDKIFIKDRLTVNGGNPTNLVIGDVVIIRQFSNQDMYDMNTKLYVGLLTETVTSNGFDVFGFDSVGFDSTNVNVINSPYYTLPRTVNKYDNLWVYRNGQRLHHYYDYTIDSDNTRLVLNTNLAVTNTDVIMVRHFSEETRPQSLEYRIFKDMNDNYEYLGIGRRFTTELAQDLSITDTEIVVKDSSKLSTPGIDANQPGVLFINGERITYWEKDDTTNTLKRIRRGTAGTGGAAVHLMNSKIEDGSTSVYIPDGDKFMQELFLSVGEDGSTLVLQSLGLQQSATPAVKFLKSLEK